MAKFTDAQIARAARIARRFEMSMSGDVDVISVYAGSAGPLNVEPGNGWATRLYEAMCELRPDIGAAGRSLEEDITDWLAYSLEG